MGSKLLDVLALTIVGAILVLIAGTIVALIGGAVMLISGWPFWAVGALVCGLVICYGIGSAFMTGLGRSPKSTFPTKQDSKMAKQNGAWF